MPGPELEKRFANRARRRQPAGIPGSSCCDRSRVNRYFVVTQWETDEAFQAWATGPAVHATRKSNAPTRWPPGPICSSSRLCWTLPGTATRPSARRVRLQRGGGCHRDHHRRHPGERLRAGTRAAGQRRGRVRIDTNTPQGVGPSRSWTCSTPTGRSDRSASRHWPPRTWSTVATTMDSLWWDRPYPWPGWTSAPVWPPCTCSTSYGARQDIELHTNDQTMVSRF